MAKTATRRSSGTKKSFFSTSDEPVYNDVSPEPEKTSVRDDDETTESNESSGEVSNKTEIVRMYIREVGVDNAHARGLNDWIKEHYPNIDFSESGRRTTLSLQKKKLGGKLSDTPAPVPSPFSDAHILTYEKLKLVKRAANESLSDIGIDSIEQLRDQLNKLSELAYKVGGFDNLVKSVDAICDLND